MNTSYKTEYGDVSVEDLVRIYNSHRRNALKHQERRSEFLQTDEGKEYNRVRAKAYYQAHKADILAKRKQQYEERKNATDNNPLNNTQGSSD